MEKHSKIEKKKMFENFLNVGLKSAVFLMRIVTAVFFDSNTGGTLFFTN